jgi:hypothetical protein
VDPIASKFSIEQMMMTLSARSRMTSARTPSILDGFLDQDFAGGRLPQAVPDDAVELPGRAGRAAPRAPEREGGAHDDRQPDLADDRLRLLEGPGAPGAGHLRADFEHCLLEELAVLGEAHGVLVGADQLHAPLVQDAALGQGERQVQGRLPADGREEGVRLLFLDDFSRNSGVSGSTYVASASSGSVMIVAGLEFTSTTRYPSLRKARTACVPDQSNSHACPITIGPDPITRIE